MFTHDSPHNDSIAGIVSAFKYDLDSQQNRDALTRVVDRISPVSLFHGHYHVRYADARKSYETGKTTNINGLGANVNLRGRVDHTAIPDKNYVIVDFR